MFCLKLKWTVIFGIFVVIATALATFLLNPPLYTATETIRIAQSQPSLVFDDLYNSRNDPANYTMYRNTQRNLLLQPFVLAAALRDSVALLPLVREQADPVGWLANKLKVTHCDQSELMIASLTLPDSKAAQQILKSVVDVYMREVVYEEHMQRREKLNRLSEVRMLFEERTRNKRSELEQLLAILEMSDKVTVEFSQRRAFQQLALVDAELARTQFDLMKAQMELDMEAGSGQAPQATSGHDAGENAEPSESSPNRLQMQKRIALITKQKEQLGRILNDLIQESKRFGRSSIEVEMLQEDIAALKLIGERITEKIEKIKIELQTSSRITRLATAEIPLVGDSTVRIYRTVIAGLLGLLPALVLLLCRRFCSPPLSVTTSRSEEDQTRSA